MKGRKYFCRNKTNLPKVLQKYTQVAQLEYQGSERHYFQLQFVEIEVNENANATVYFNRILRRMTRNCVSNIKQN